MMLVMIGGGRQSEGNVGGHSRQGRQREGRRIRPTDKTEQQQRGDESAFHQSTPTNQLLKFSAGSSVIWVTEHRRDHFFKLARREAARSA